jgi:hypothetical protein
MGGGGGHGAVDQAVAEGGDAKWMRWDRRYRSGVGTGRTLKKKKTIKERIKRGKGGRKESR